MLVLVFALLALAGETRQGALSAYSSVPASAKIAFTRLGVENRLTGYGYTLSDGTLTGPAGQTASLSFTEEGNTLASASLTFRSETAGRTLPGGRIGEMQKAAQDSDDAFLKDVFSCLSEASSPKAKQDEKETDKALALIESCVREGKSGSTAVNGRVLTLTLEPSRESAAVTMTLAPKE